MSRYDLVGWRNESCIGTGLPWTMHRIHSLDHCRNIRYPFRELFGQFRGDHERTCAVLHTNDGKPRRVRMERPKSTPNCLWKVSFTFGNDAFPRAVPSDTVRDTQLKLRVFRRWIAWQIVLDDAMNTFGNTSKGLAPKSNKAGG